MRLAAILMCLCSAVAQSPPRPAPANESLSYTVEWRLLHAGNAVLDWSSASAGWRTKLSLQSVGLVSSLFKVNNTYSSNLNKDFCVESSVLQVNEGSKRHEMRATFDGRKATYQDRDLVKNEMASAETEVLPCEHDVIGALYRLRATKLEPGQSTQIPISDGKKAVMAKVEAQERETVKTDNGSYRTIRYEAFLFNNVLYRRRGRLLVWLTDDEHKTPVQIRVRLPFYIGTVTLQLDKVKRA
jgi:hypothetical protein